MPTVDLLSAVRLTRYPLEAFLFIQRGLDWTVRQIHGEADHDTVVHDLDDPASSARHVTGQELCLGLRDYARDRYGRLAGTVLRNWGIRSCEDFGHIVFAMVEAELMHKNDEDSLHDFVDVFDFRDDLDRYALDLAGLELD